MIQDAIQVSRDAIYINYKIQAKLIERDPRTERSEGELTAPTRETSTSGLVMLCFLTWVLVVLRIRFVKILVSCVLMRSCTFLYLFVYTFITFLKC